MSRNLRVMFIDGILRIPLYTPIILRPTLEMLLPGWSGGDQTIGEKEILPCLKPRFETWQKFVLGFSRLVAVNSRLPEILDWFLVPKSESAAV